MAEGLLRADSRRGTFVNPIAATSASTAKASAPRAPLHATVAIVASVVSPPPDESTHWPLLILRACEDYLGTVPGVTTRFFNTWQVPPNPAPERDLINDLEAAAADAIILVSSTHLLAPISAQFSTPLINVACDPHPGAIREITVDESFGGLHAAQHLLQQGYRDLLFFRPFTTPDWVEGRLAGARTAASRFASRPLVVAPNTPEPLPGGAQAWDQYELALRSARVLLARGLKRGTGVVTPNDPVAKGFIVAALERDLHAGKDYGIIGFDDYGRDADLSTMRPPLEQMGIEAGRMVESVLRGEAGPSRIMLYHRLIGRESTRRWVDIPAPRAGTMRSG